MDYLMTFIEGIASFISPCVLPMLPIYISYFAGKDEEKKNKTLINALGFVLGFSIIFIILSIFASTFGKMIASHLKYINIIFGLIIIILGLNYIEIIKLKFLNKENRVKSNVKNLNFFKSLIFGMAFSISWTPCIGTFLASALLLISSKSETIKGILLITSYSIGLGIPFIISALLIDKMKKVFSIFLLLILGGMIFAQSADFVTELLKTEKATLKYNQKNIRDNTNSNGNYNDI